MKYRILILLFSLFLSLSSKAQKKFLFDATKAETAGNADWVIDADQFNLGYPNGFPVPGTGSESNPQEFPTPLQSTVTASTAETYWTGAISAWGIDLVKQGYEVSTLPYNGRITYGDQSNPQDLSNYNVFVVDEPNNAFSDTEKTAILNFVKNGGGLFMISDHNNSDRNNSSIDSPHVWNDLMQNNSVQTNPFGITFDYAYFDDKTENIPNLPSDPLLHGPMGDVTRVEFYGGTSMTLNPTANRSVTAVVYKSGSSFNDQNVLVAYATFGEGKVVAMGDSSPADDGTGDPNDRLYDGWITDANGNHERLIMNGSIWLAETITGIQEQAQEKDKVIVVGIKNNIKINFPATVSGQNRVVLYNAAGKKVYCLNHLTSDKTYHTALQKGVYIYKFEYPDGKTKTGKVFLNP
ncbi:MAG: T9SS type A sorting domain-containing protein [Bacteroidales bacterium]|nr:T9SS type A sorting domain-containing protein [Bacteroidales bacterium]